MVLKDGIDEYCRWVHLQVWRHWYGIPIEKQSILEKLVHIVQLIWWCLRRCLAIMEGHCLLCLECLVMHVICDSVKFSMDILVGYRALQMPLQLPDFV